MKIILREYAIPIDPANPPIGPGVTPLAAVAAHAVQTTTGSNVASACASATRLDEHRLLLLGRAAGASEHRLDLAMNASG